MPSLNGSDNSVQVHVATTADKSGIEDTQKGLKDLADTGGETDKKLSEFTGSFTDGMKKVAGFTAVAGAGLTLYAKNGVDKLQDLVKGSKTLATQTGMTAIESSKLVAVFGRMGTDSTALTANFRIFSKTIADARDNVGENAVKQKELANKVEATKIQIAELTEEIRINGDSSGAMRNRVEGLTIQLQGYEESLGDSSNGLTKLNISTVDASGVNKDFSSILMEVADKFKAMPSGAEKTALALDLFGRSGAGMIKVLDQGSEGITKLSAEADKLGLTLTGDNIETINNYVKAQKELADSTSAISLAVGALTAPLLTEMNVQMNNVIMSLIGTDGPLKDITVGFLAFGGPVLGATSAVIGLVANLATAAPAFKAFAAMIGTPIIMPAIAVAAALAAIALVWDAYNKMKDAVEGAQRATDSLATEKAKITARFKEVMADPNSTAEQKDRWRGAMTRIGQNATGTNNWSGGPTWVGENGPEIINAPQGSKIYTNKDSERIAQSQGGMTINIDKVILSTAESVNTFMNYKDQDAQMTQIGLSPARGIA